MMQQMRIKMRVKKNRQMRQMKINPQNKIELTY